MSNIVVTILLKERTELFKKIRSAEDKVKYYLGSIKEEQESLERVQAELKTLQNTLLQVENALKREE